MLQLLRRSNIDIITYMCCQIFSVLSSNAVFTPFKFWTAKC
jgi:hypothetical protein